MNAREIERARLITIVRRLPLQHWKPNLKPGLLMYACHILSCMAVGMILIVLTTM